MTLEERLALARGIAARTPPRFVVDTSRDEARQRSFRKAKKVSEILRAKRTKRVFLKQQQAPSPLSQLNWPQMLEPGYYPAVWLNAPFATFATAASLGSVRKYTR
jgi:hypothetical protein